MSTAYRTDAGRAAARVSSEILDRLPPHNLDAEKGVLGSILLDPNLCDDVALVAPARRFLRRRQPEALRPSAGDARRGQPHRRHAAVGAAARRRRPGGRSAARPTWPKCSIRCPYAANAVYYAEIVRDKATLRALIHASTEILRDAYEPTLDPRELVSRAEEQIFAVHDQRSTDQVTNIHDLLVEAFDRIDARLEHGEGVGVPTGFQDLDNLTGGLHDSEFVVLAARPSMGKTALATNIAEYVAIEANVPTLFVSLEMARLELAQRMLCSQGRIDANKFRSGFLSKDDRSKLVEASAKLGKAPLFIDDTPGRTVHRNRRLCPAAEAEAEPGADRDRLLAVDPARRPARPASGAGGQDGPAAEGLGPRAEDSGALPGPVEPPGRAGKEGHRPRLSHLRESGAIEQDADVVMFVHREEYYSTAARRPRKRAYRGQADLIVAKQRNGPTGDVKLAWFDKYTRFENLSQKPYEEFGEYQEEF